MRGEGGKDAPVCFQDLITTKFRETRPMNREKQEQKKRQAEYLNSLDSALDRIFERADDLGFAGNKLASLAGVCNRTVYRIDNRKTRLPRLKTIWLLAKAVGMRFALEEVRRMRRAS